MSEPVESTVITYATPRLRKKKQAHNTDSSQSVHLIVSQGGPPILKASMTKHRNSTKQLDISAPILEKKEVKMLLAMKVSKMKSSTHLKIR